MPEPSLNEKLSSEGLFVVPSGALDRSTVAAPWSFAEHLVGEAPRMVERQIVRAVLHGRSFAATCVETPVHNDLQRYLGRIADLQVLACIRAATDGGVSTLLDTWPLLERARYERPKLYEALFTERRSFPFVAGAVTSPTVALLGGRLTFLHAPLPAPKDPLRAEVLSMLGAVAPRYIPLKDGEVLVVDNHRVLHGRTAFEDRRRELVRVLVWLREPRPVPEHFVAQARHVGQSAEPDPIAEADLASVLRMLTGGSPGAIAEQSAIGEPALYEMRDTALAAALEALRRRRRS